VWKAAWCFFPSGDRAGKAWVGEQARRVLAGRAVTVAAAIRRKATVAKLPAAQRAGADTCAGYLHAKAPYPGYGRALAAGRPIATGIVEGACRYLTGTAWASPEPAGA
jgi:hypothetical protein